MNNFTRDVLELTEGKSGKKTVFQPRINWWHRVLKQTGKLPEKYRDMDFLDICRDLNISLRTYEYFNGCLDRNVYSSKIKYFRKITESVNRRDYFERWETPVGEIVRERSYTLNGNHIRKFPVSTPDDLKVLEYIFRATSLAWDQQLYDKNLKAVSDLGPPTIYFGRINIMTLFVDWMGFEAAVFAQYDYPEAIRNFVDAYNEYDDKAMTLIAECPVRIINYGDNIDANMASPQILEEFILPRYEERYKILKPAGKFIHSHWDGSIKNILHLAKQAHVDGFEAFTPFPQGDVTVEEIKEAIGDDIFLLDMLPMLAFMPDYDKEELCDLTHKIIELFSPKLILGVSDCISPNCDIERIRFVSDIVAKVNEENAKKKKEDTSCCLESATSTFHEFNFNHFNQSQGRK